VTGATRRALSAAALGTVALLGVPAAPAGAQVAPDARWLTIRTEHFRVHFTRETEALARRAAGNAERAYAQLAAELTPPRGPIDLVLSDDVDYTNGYASTVPTNRIVVYASPPVDQASLRFYDDWNTLVVSHELTHVFHLDRTRGWWRLGQRLFGRSPFLFPNAYLPSWATEGIAVYYETRLTGSGRAAATQHRSLARAAALGGATPALDALSLASSRFPGGEATYAYGGLFIDWLARTRGDSGVRRFVESVARAPIPFFLDRSARRGFGVSFTRAWDAWRDSLAAGVAGRADSGRGTFAQLTPGLWQAQGPRWTGNDRLVAGLNTGRDVPGAYALTPGGALARLGRRNDATPNAPLADGALVYAQLDFTDPYRVRSDLYVQRDGRETRLTRGARLARPDARADGAIVAVRSVPGATHLVRVSPDGRTIAPLTAAAADTHWAEPRWSPEGARVVAVRWSSGGMSEVVVLDTLGAVREVVARGRAVHGAPAFTPDGAGVVYVSDSGGHGAVYRARLRETDAGPAPAPARLGDDPRALFFPDLSPDGRRLAAVRLGATGYEVVTADVAAASAAGRTADGPSAGATGGAANGDDRFDRPAVPALPPAQPSDAPSRPYSPWRTLLPRYWMPLASLGDRGESWIGAATSGTDVVGRHAYSAQALVGAASGLREYAASYRYAGLGRPLLDVAFDQTWTRASTVTSDGEAVGTLRRRERTAGLTATLQRPRFRTSAWASAGAEVEWHDWATDPGPLREALQPAFRELSSYPSVRVAAGFGNTRRPALSISPEDGVSLSGSLRQRWLDGDVRPFTRSATGVAAAYRSLPWLPGFAHHVLAARVAGGWADDAATSEFEVGGVSGGTLEVLPGLAVGQGARTFGVRGVPAAAQAGTRAVAGTLEYRAPLAVAGRGIGRLPLFVDRASVALFGETGAAWCPTGAADRPACRGAAAEPEWLRSAGAELDLDVALQYDVLYRFRVGVAVPQRNAAAGVAGGAQAYVTVGRAF
jgi:hypothetical protein